MIYQRQHFLIASKHEKEKAIAPIIKKRLNGEVFVKEFDTDQFGTFTGEIPRVNSAKDTCIQKARQAGLLFNHPYVIANEGSFGPHPLNPFMAIAQEFMVFLDLNRDILIVEEEFHPHTNYQTMVIDKGSTLDDFLAQANFPSHALCLQSYDQSHLIAKGIQVKQDLDVYLEHGFAHYKKLLISTDMRAMMNPTRMVSIAKLCDKLVNRMLNFCPSCALPGFGKIGVDGKLPCEDCHQPSQWYAVEILGCVKCNYKQSQQRSDGMSCIASQYCQYCNP